MKYISILFVFYMMIPALSASHSIVDWTIEDYIDEGARQYRQLIDFNAVNSAAGCTEENWYVFSFNPNDNWLELSEEGMDAEGNELYSPQKLQEINDLLVTFNQTAETQMYVCVVTDWKVGLKPYHPEKLIHNNNPSIKTKDLLLEFSSDDKRVFRDSIQGRFNIILQAILQNSHQGGEYSLFTEDNRVVWGISEFRAKFFFGQDKLSGGVIEGWAANPVEFNSFTNEQELFDYVRFVKDHRDYNDLNSRESKVRHNVEGFTEYISGGLDSEYIPLVDQLSFESFHYIPWETIPEHLKSHDGGESFEAAVAIAAAEIQLKRAENLSLDLLDDSDQHRFTVNAATTSFHDLSRRKMEQLDDKCAYLAHKTGLEFFIYFKHVEFLMQPEEYNVFANQIFVESGLNELENGAVLLCFPYFMPGEDVLNVDGLNLTEHPSVMPGIATSANLLGTDFFSEVNDVISQDGLLWDFMKLAFKHSPKPHKVHGATLMLGNFREENFASRIFIEDMTSPEQPEIVTGFFNMNDLYLYEDKRIAQLRQLEGQKLTTCIAELELSESAYTVCDDLANEIDALYKSPPGGFDVLNYDFQIKEKFLDPELPNLWEDGQHLVKYAVLEFKSATTLLDKWLIEFSDLEDEGIVYDIGFYDLAYDPLDAASLIPGIGELADGVILLVGLSEVILGEDTERGMMAVAGSGLGLFLIGDNYIEVPLRQGKKLFIGPGIGFITKDAIAQGTDPVRVQKIFGLGDAGPGSTAMALVNNTTSDGRRMHRVLLENDKLFDHIRVMPRPERHAFLLEMTNSPNLLESVFDNAEVSMKPVSLWRKIHAMEPMAKEAMDGLTEAEKIVFYQHLDQYGDVFYTYMNKQQDEIDAVGAWLVFREHLEAFGTNETGLFKAQSLLEDLNDQGSLINHFRDRPNFVVAWDVLFGQGEEALLAMRTNWENIDIVDEYLFEYPDRLEDLRVDYILAEEKEPFVLALLGPGQPGDYIQHRVRGLYENIFPSEDLNGILDDVEENVNSIRTLVEPEFGIRPGDFERKYESGEDMFIFKAGFRYHAPKFLDNGHVPLVEGKGIPTQMLVSLRQMKMLEIPDGSLKKAKMDMIQNVETMIYVTHLMVENGSDDITLIGNDILDAPSVQYAISTLKQAGYRISNASLSYRPSSTIITIQSAVDDFPLDNPISEDFINQFGFDWDSPIVVNFDIFFELEPF